MADRSLICITGAIFFILCFLNKGKVKKWLRHLGWNRASMFNFSGGGGGVQLSQTGSRSSSLWCDNCCKHGCYREMESDASLLLSFLPLLLVLSFLPAACPPTNPCSLRLHSLIWCSCRSVRAVASRYLANWRMGKTAVTYGLRSRPVRA